MKSLLLIAALPLAAGAFQAHAQGMTAPKESKPAATTARAAPPFIDAEVTEVDTKGATVTLKHEDIPNLNMPAMTMPFEVADPKMLTGLKAGDKIRGQFDTVQGKMLMIKVEPRK